VNKKIMGLTPFLQGKRLIYPLLVTALLMTFVPPAHGGDEKSLPWEISADHITHLQEPGEIIAEGEVFLRQYAGDTPTGLTIEADRIQYFSSDNALDATGNLHIKDRDNEVWASEAQIDLASRLGSFREATIFWEDSNLFVNATLIEKTADEFYRIENGRFTTCPYASEETPDCSVWGRSPDWSIWGREAKISVNDYASLKHATFRIKDFPVFYLPYFRIPIGRDKKSGFLFPEYSSSSRNGTGLIAPYFINLSPSYDMTLFPGYYSERGFVAAGEFRYIADYNSRGTFMINYLDDALEDTIDNDFKSDGRLRTNSRRYWFRGKADHDFGNRLVAKLDMDLVSDRDYLEEFRKGIIGFDQSNTDFLEIYRRGFQPETIYLRENTLQLSKIWMSTDLQAEVSIIDDLRDAPDEITPPWVLPRIAYSGLLPFLHTPLDLVWGTEYVYFWRDEGVGAHRIDLFPQINGPFPFSSPYLETSYLLGIRETLYFIEPHDSESETLYDGRDFEERTLAHVQFTGATTLSRDYELSSDKYKSFRHAVRPELSYLVVQGSDQDDLPFLDDEDRVLEKNWLQYSLNNYFRAIRLDEISLFRTNFSSFKVSQVYDIDAEDHPFSDIYFEFIIRGFKNLSLSYENTVSVYGEGVTTNSLSARYKNQRGDRLNFNYHYKRDPEISPPYFYSVTGADSLSELNARLESRISRLFSVKFDTTYSLSSGNTVNSTLSLIYHNPCWTLEFAAERSTDDTGFYLVLSLAGIGTPMDISLPEF
jgi:LPS-assembly protein